MIILDLAVKSSRNRKFTTGLTILSIALSVMLLLGIEKIRHGAETGFTSVISGTDLIVGARSSQVQLLLFSVFHIGNPTNNISKHSYEMISDHPRVKWAIPLSLGDSHKGYRVVGTTVEFYEHYQFANNRQLTLDKGEWFVKQDDAVIGAEVAESLNYQLEDQIVIAHGSGEETFIDHADKPFHVAGILGRTGTPIDRSVYVSLESIDAIHGDMYGTEHSHDPLMGYQQDEPEEAYEEAHEHDESHREGHEHEESEGQGGISAVLVGLDSRGAALGLQRGFNEHRHEPLTAIMPGVVLLEIWHMLGVVERILLAISALVVAIGLFSMLIILMTSMNERRREMAIFRSVGARPVHVFSLIMGEALFVTLLGVALGVFLVYGLLALLQPWLESVWGLYIIIGWPTSIELYLMMLIALCGFLVGLVPGIRIYQYSLSDGMTIRM